MHVNLPGLHSPTVTSSADGGDGELVSPATSSKLSTLSERGVLELVRACSWTLVWIGSNWEVWEVRVCWSVYHLLAVADGFSRCGQVERVCRQNPDGNVVVDIKLVPYEGTEMPEQFLVTVG